MDELNYDPNDSSNLLKFLRLSNIFSPTFPRDVEDKSGLGPSDRIARASLDQVPNQSSSGIDMNQVIQKLMSPDEEMFNRMKSQVDEMPLLSNFKNPGLWTKIRAHLAAMGADNAAQARQIREGIEHEPYLKALDAWKMRLDPTQELAKMENTRNVNARLTGSTILSNESTNKRLTEQARKDREAELDRDLDRQIRQQRADTYDFKTRHPTFKTATRRDGKLVFYDPADPSKTIVSDIDTGKLSDVDKINLEHQGNLEEIQERGKIAKSLEGERQVNRKELSDLQFGHQESLEETKQQNRLKTEGVRQQNRIEVKKIPSASSNTTTQSETQKKQGLINKANKIISENPELKSYIIFEKNNAGTVQGVRIAPSGIFGDEQKRMKAYNLLFGQEPVPGVTQDKNVTPQSKVTKPNVRADGKTHVRLKKTGQVGWVTNPDMSKYDLEP